MLAELAGLDVTGTPTFTDTDASVHAGAIAALSEAGVVGGFADGSFEPALAVRRDQAASMLMGVRARLLAED